MYGTHPLHHAAHLGVLFGELHQHGVVEELLNGNILRETLTPPSLHHEVARKLRRWRRLERMEHDAAVQRVAGHNRPVVECLKAHGLALGERAKVGLKAERVDGGQVGLDRVERRTRLWCVLHHVATPPRQHRKDRGHDVGRRLDLQLHHRLHQPRGRHEERRVRHPPRRRDDLAAAAVNGLRGDGRVEDLELGVADRLVAQRALAAAPLEALDDALLHLLEQLLVDLARQGVVH
mmetsp:Transcript_36568/g.97749  ORF Transcript_36568/g.97749 Transcript_36568/m.97749 type:complete len:235 (+) Transcript_36568:52-756(+)